MRHRWNVAILCVASLGGGPLLAAEPDSIKGDQLVQEALHHELYGMQAERDRLLKQASTSGANAKAAMWHLGHVRLNGKWLSADKVPATLQDNLVWKRYESQRAAAEDTVAGQLKLADYCARQGLDSQERAHLNRVIQLDPNNSRARSRLGYRRVEGMWVTNAELEEARADARQMLKDLAAWRPRMTELKGQLSQRSLKKRTAAAEAIKTLDNPSAIPAMETVLSDSGRDASLFVLEA